MFRLFVVLGVCLSVLVATWIVLGKMFWNKVLTPPVSIPSPSEAGEFIDALSVYSRDQLSNYEKELLEGVQYPKISSVKTEGYKEVYLVDCEVDNSPKGVTVSAKTESIKDGSGIIENTIRQLIEKNFGEFPGYEEIANYEKINNVSYKHKDSGVNGVKQVSKGVYVVNFYDSVAAYGGGSSRVGCMRLSTNLTLKQFPEVKEVIMCIDQYPSRENRDCMYDFQP